LRLRTRAATAPSPASAARIPKPGDFGVSGVTGTSVDPAFFTVMVLDADLPVVGLVTVIVTVPSLIALTVPSSPTDAMDASDDFHTKVEDEPSEFAALKTVVSPTFSAAAPEMETVTSTTGVLPYATILVE